METCGFARCRAASEMGSGRVDSGYAGGLVFSNRRAGLIAFWLLLATLHEWALRIKLGREPLQDSLARMRRMPRAAHGMTLAHLGVAVVMLGMIGSSAWKSEEVLFVEPGAQVSIAGFDVTFEGVTAVRGPNYIAQVGALKIMRDGKDLGYLNPERRTYPDVAALV